MKKSATKKSKRTTAENLEERFDAGLDVLDYFDADSAVFRVNVDFPVWMVQELDRESERRGVARQALVKMWIADRIDQQRAEKKRSPARSPRRRNAV